MRSSNNPLLVLTAEMAHKGLDYLVEAFQQIVLRDKSYRLIIAGNPN